MLKSVNIDAVKIVDVCTICFRNFESVGSTSRLDSLYANTWKYLPVDIQIYLQYFKKTHTHIRLTALCPGLPGWAGTRKVKPNWILLKQETVNDDGIRWAICKSAPRSRQISTLVPHILIFILQYLVKSMIKAFLSKWLVVVYCGPLSHVEICEHWCR